MRKFILTTLLSVTSQGYAYDLGNDIEYTSGSGGIYAIAIFYALLFILSKNDDFHEKFIKKYSTGWLLALIVFTSVFIAILLDK